MRIDNEIDKVLHDLRICPAAEREKFTRRLKDLADLRHAMWDEEGDVLSRYEREMKPEAIKPSSWWDKLRMRPAGDTTLKDGQWEDTKI